MNKRFDDIADWFEKLSPETLGAIDLIYAPKATFIDPFNAVHDREMIKAIYQHMFKSLEQPKFKIIRKIVADSSACMIWRFSFGLRNTYFDFEGSTVFEINDQGLITLHHDYWDPSRELYEHIPLLGRIFRKLRLMLAQKQSH